MELRIGQGVDFHRFAPNRKLILGGVEIPSELGLEGHSDADVLIHALMDAMLGAAGLGDIGTQFPNTDERYRGISSVLLLREVKAKLDADNWRIQNCDCTLVLERPKIAPHIMKMKELLASTLDIDVSSVGIKATTSERLGSLGRGEGAFATAVTLLIRNVPQD